FTTCPVADREHDNRERGLPVLIGVLQARHRRGCRPGPRAELGRGAPMEGNAPDRGPPPLAARRQPSRPASFRAEQGAEASLAGDSLEQVPLPAEHGWPKKLLGPVARSRPCSAARGTVSTDSTSTLLAVRLLRQRRQNGRQRAAKPGHDVL